MEPTKFFTGGTTSQAEPTATKREIGACLIERLAAYVVMAKDNDLNSNTIAAALFGDDRNDLKSSEEIQSPTLGFAPTMNDLMDQLETSLGRTAMHLEKIASL